MTLKVISRHLVFGLDSASLVCCYLKMKNRLILFAISFLLINCSSASKESKPGGNGYSGHGSESLSTDTIQKYSAPALPPEVSRRIQSMLDIKSPGMGMLAPDASEMFFGWRVTGTAQVWKLTGPQKFPTQMTGGSDQTQVVGILPNGKWIVLSRDRNGEENPGLYLQSRSGGALIEIQHKAKVQTGLNWIDADSENLYFSSNDIKPDSYAIYRYSLKSKAKELIFDQPGIWYIADKRDDGLLLLGKATGSLSREFFTYDERTKKLTPVLGQEEKVEYDMLFSSKANEFIVRTNKLGDFHRVYRYANKTFTPITEERKADVTSIAMDRPRTKLVMHWNVGGFTRLEVLDTSNFKSLDLPKFEKADHIYAGGFTPNGQYMTIGIETAKAPRTSYVYNWRTQKATQWVLPSAPEIDTSSFSTTKIEEYPARDGTMIPMLVRRPAQCKQTCPVIVHFHGGPEGQSQPGFKPIWQLFIDAGFIVIEPNVRGSDGYGKSWMSSDDGPKRLAVITDIEDASTYIRKSFVQNGKVPKIGIMGWSYGGYATLIGMSMYAGSYDAGAALVGMSNLVTFLQNTAPYRRILRISEYGDPDKDREALLKLSPVTYVDKIKNPLLIIQGVSDPRVPAGEALQMHQILQSKGIPSSLILFADEGHGSQKRENQVLEYGHILSFFEKHLK